MMELPKNYNSFQSANSIGFALKNGALADLRVLLEDVDERINELEKEEKA